MNYHFFMSADTCLLEIFRQFDTIPAFERMKTVYALDLAATVIGFSKINFNIILSCKSVFLWVSVFQVFLPEFYEALIFSRMLHVLQSHPYLLNH
jgi:hypothetical protein